MTIMPYACVLMMFFYNITVTLISNSMQSTLVSDDGTSKLKLKAEPNYLYDMSEQRVLLFASLV